MESNVYQKEAMRTLNPKLNPQEVLVNSVMGLCGESGEAVDLVKKHLFQGHPLDEEHLKKELGDIAWYLAEACTALNVNLDEVLQGNLDKLAKRYPDGFSTADSEKRKPEDL
jgi:NTP pyrophosphatase (non-canonical NTP hydrolase)